MAEPNKCPKCDGEGRVANTDDQEPWSVWASLPLQSALAVVMGPPPFPCRDMRGTYFRVSQMVSIALYFRNRQISLALARGEAE